MGPKIKEHNIGDLVENIAYLRRPRLKGVIVECTGYDKELDDFIYRIYCYNTSKYEFWPHRNIKKI